MKRLAIFAIFVVMEICASAQITRDSALVIVKQSILNGDWLDKEIYASVSPMDTSISSNINNVSHLNRYWFFFVDEKPYANWDHPCKYIYIDVNNGDVLTFNKSVPPSNIRLLDIIYSVRPRKATEPNQLFKIPVSNNPRNTNTSENEYAVIISGGCNSAKNWERYWNDCSAMYKVLVNVYNYDKSKIFVLMSDGTNPGTDMHLNNDTYISSPLDLDGDGNNDIQYSATYSNISLVFDSLARVITDTDNVFVFVTDHGGEGSTICLWNDQNITTSQFATEINKVSAAKTINICMEQCFSGGYTTALAGCNRVISTACSYNEFSHSTSDYVYDEFCYHWISAVLGATPNGTPVNADYNNDGHVSMDEAFYYANTHDTQIETPQYYSNKSCLGESLALNGVYNNSCIFYDDLFVRDSVSDDGSMPSDVSFNWNSPDIWIEDLSGNRVENPAGNTLYKVCVRVHNSSNCPSSGKERLFLNWAKAGINDYWYENWTSYTPLPCNTHPFKGGVIGSPNGMPISPMPANSSKIVKVLWLTPMGEDYNNCNEFTNDQWHFCLLARVHDDYAIAHENEQQTGVYWLVRDHNNVAQKNIYLNQSASHKSVISISNPTSNYITRFLRLIKRNNNFEEKITDFAEISLKLDADLISSINYDLLTGAKFVNDNTLLITDDDFVLPLQLTAGQYSTLSTSVNFLTNKNPQNDTTHFDIVAFTDEDFSEISSGQGFNNIYTAGRTFHANAGNDTAILIGTNAVLHATQINEDATYRWYDKQRNFKYEGVNFSVIPLQTSEYILEVTAESDGYRNLDTVKVNVVPGCIRSITPNPVSDNWVTVSYEYATMVTSAHLYIYNTGTTTLVGSYDLSNLGNVSSLDIEVTYYPTGSYTVVLVCDNAVCHNKVLIRQ